MSGIERLIPTVGPEEDPDIIDLAQHAVTLASSMLDAKAELEKMPRAALVLAASQELAAYHQEFNANGETPEFKKLYFNKTTLLSFLTDEEREMVKVITNEMLDENLDQSA
jgi:hypothetical protein